MIGALLALFKRSLREDCRAKINYVARAGLLCVVLVFLISTHESRIMGAPGLDFFGSVIYINCVFIILGGLGHFASAITEEKEEMTLGLLRMTNLNPLSILLGKSASRIFNAILLLLVQFPFTLLAVSMGGVSIHQVVSAYCTLGAFVVLLGGVAVFFSVISRRTSLAVIFTALLFFIFFFGPFFVNLLITEDMPGFEANNAYPAVKSVLNHIVEASPLTRLESILKTGFAGPPAGYQVVTDVATGLLFFLLAWLCFNIFCRHETEASPGRSPIFRKLPLLRRLNAGRAWRTALFWKDFNFMTGGKMGMLIKSAFLTLLVAYLYCHMINTGYNYRDEWSEFGGAITTFMTLFLALELSIAAARIFRQEIAWQTLSSIALLPISTRSLIYRKVMGHLLAATPTVLYLALGLTLLWGNRSHLDGDDVMAMFLVFSEGLLLVHLTAYLSLVLKRAALPLAIGIMFIGNMIMGMLMDLMFRGDPLGPDGVIFLMSMVMLGLTAVFHTIIGGRLRHAAAQD